MVSVQVDIKSIDPQQPKIHEALVLTLDNVSNILLGELKKKSPVDHGRLQGSWSEPESNGDLSKIITNSSGYADFVDKGTRPHIIRAVNKPYLQFVVDGHFVQVEQVNHPGTEGVHFVDESMEIAKSRVEEEFIKACIRVKGG